MHEPVRLGLVGAGAISQAYVDTLSHCSIAKLVAVMDARKSAARAAAEVAGCEPYTSLEDFTDQSHCDAVVIATPPSSHAELAVYFLERGIPVLCEKPLSTDLDSARRMSAAAAKNGVPLAMASKFRYVSDIIEAKAIIESGGIGDVLFIENSFTAAVNMSDRWNSDPKVSGGGVLIDNGTHSVDIVRYLLGPISDVLAVVGSNAQHLPVEDSATLHTRTASHADGLIDLSWSLQKDQASFVRVFGTGGAIQVGWKGSRYRRSSSPDWVEFGQGYQKNDAFRRKVVNFSNYLLGREELLIDLDDALASVEAIQAAYESLKSGKWTPVGSTQPREVAVGAS